MFIQLPSERKLAYVRPRIETNKFGRESITYEGVGTTKVFERLETYGAKLCENICQGISRDILANSMINIENNDYKIIMHVHDEIIVEADKYTGTLQQVCNIMTKEPKWAMDLPLVADGYECEYYRKE